MQSDSVSLDSTPNAMKQKLSEKSKVCLAEIDTLLKEKELLENQNALLDSRLDETSPLSHIEIETLKFYISNVEKRLFEIRQKIFTIENEIKNSNLRSSV